MTDTPDKLTQVFQAMLDSPIEDRTEAILLIAGGGVMMQAEPRHAVALVDFMGDAA